MLHIILILLHGGAVAAAELQSLVEHARLVGSQLCPDVVNATGIRLSHLGQCHRVHDVTAASL